MRALGGSTVIRLELLLSRASASRRLSPMSNSRRWKVGQHDVAFEFEARSIGCDQQVDCDGVCESCVVAQQARGVAAQERPADVFEKAEFAAWPQQRVEVIENRAHVGGGQRAERDRADDEVELRGSVQVDDALCEDVDAAMCEAFAQSLCEFRFTLDEREPVARPQHLDERGADRAGAGAGFEHVQRSSGRGNRSGVAR